jgi:hypothetical protein
LFHPEGKFFGVGVEKAVPHRPAVIFKKEKRGGTKAGRRPLLSAPNAGRSNITTLMKTSPNYLCTTAAALVFAAFSGTTFAETQPVPVSQAGKTHLLVRRATSAKTHHVCFCKKCKNCRCWSNFICKTWH